MAFFIKPHHLFIFIIVSLSYCTSNGNNVVLSDGCPVNRTKPCVPKCCDLGQSFKSGSNCTSDPETDFLPTFEDCPDISNQLVNTTLIDRYEFFIGKPCLSEWYILEKDKAGQDNWTLFSNGTLWTPSYVFTLYDFCVENYNNTINAFICFEASENDSAFVLHFSVYPVLLLFSVPFLILTAVTYTFIEEFRDLQGKALSCQATCLAIAYFILSIIQLGGNNIIQEFCTGIAFALQFFFLASFFWLNVLSFDSYRNLKSDPRSLYTRGAFSSEKKLFIMYSIYAWSFAALILIISLIMDFSPGISDYHIKPKFGLQSCWFQTAWGALTYFYGPVGFFLAVNLVFFGLSARAIYDEQKKSSRDRIMNPKRTKNERRVQLYIATFKQCVLLFLVMGLNWLTEIISWAVGGSQYIWVATDIFNAIQGIVIFYIFVIKQRRVRTEFFRRLQKLCRCFSLRKTSKDRDEVDITSDEDDSVDSVKLHKQTDL